MKYIDSGSRNPADALGTWLQNQTTSSISALRWQSGFFTADGLQPLVPVLKHLASNNLTTYAVIGSNEGETLESDVSALVSLLGMPRGNAKVGVVSYSGAYYHPKTYHLRRRDGSQAAYVGSANLTLAGVGALHVEAGVILDSADGDPVPVLDAIADAVDAWFGGGRIGVEVVTDISDVAALTTSGVLSIARPPKPTPVVNVGSGPSRPPRPRLQPLVRFAQSPTAAAGATSVARRSSQVATNRVGGQSTSIASVPQSPPFPPYVLFAPGAATPTFGPTALSGATLPGGAAGIVVRLNRDSARHWLKGTGTSNISIPVPTIPTLRFGLFQGRYQRPRAEYVIQMRYVSAAGSYVATAVDTNVMVYGFAPGENGHGDVRLVVPKPPAREIADYATRNRLPLPNVGDVALLEWPTPLQSEMRLTLIARSTPLFTAASGLLTNAATANQLVGQGACWLPVGLSPMW